MVIVMPAYRCLREHRMLQRSFLLLLTGLLIACGSTAPAPLATPTPAVARATPGAQTLPAPLYTLDRGQIARIETDGITRRQITRERIELEGIPPISDVDIHPTAGLVYVVGAAAGDWLVRAATDGSNRQVLYDEAGHQLSDVRWSPDARYIYLRFQNNREPRDLPDGLYRIPATGGALEPILTDDPVDDPLNPSRAVRSYAPVSWNPDGTILLVASFATFYQDCALGLFNPTSRALRLPVLPEGMQSLCGEATWRADGNAAVMLIGPPTGPGVWQIDAQSLQPTKLSAGEALARAPFIVGDDLLFVAVERQADGFRFTLTRQSPDGAHSALRPPFSDIPLIIQWAPDGSGIVALVRTERGNALRWYPIGEQPPVELPQSEAGVTWFVWHDQ